MEYMPEKIVGKAKVKVFRFDPSMDKEPRYKTYEVPLCEHMSVLGVLDYIYKNIDSSLAFYFACRNFHNIPRCHGCDLFVNGRAKFACCTLATEEMTIEPPISIGFEVIRDLIPRKFPLSIRDRENRYIIPRSNAFHRFKKAYDKVKKMIEFRSDSETE